MKANWEAIALRMKERGIATRARLAEMAGISVKSLKRIEQGKASNRNTTERLAKALDTTPEALCAAPDAEARRKAQKTLEELGYKDVVVRLDRPTRLALRLVLDRYGVGIPTLIKLTPLFAVILFEKALAERRTQLAAFEAAWDAALAQSPIHLPHALHSIDNALICEENSISANDICGAAREDDVFNPDGLNLFERFLRAFTADIDSDLIDIDEASGVSLDSLRFSVLDGPLNDLTNGDRRALFALENDHVRLRDMPPALRGADQSEARAAWLASHVTDADWAAEQQRVEDFISNIDL